VVSTARPEEAAEPRLLASGLLGVVARFLPESGARPDAGQARRLRTFAGIGDPPADELAAEMAC
jgi:hypothetical protein